MMIARVYLVGAIVLILSTGMMVRLWYLQIVDKDFLQDQGDARTIRMERINAHRGMIQDRFGKPLAVSTPALSLWANPSEVLEADKSLQPIAEYLKTSQEQFRVAAGPLDATMHRREGGTGRGAHRSVPRAQEASR